MPSKKNETEEEVEKNLDTGNIFDRIFRENSPRMIAWIERRFGYQIEKYALLKEKIAKTLEREIDFLCRITTKTGEELLLHMEFQAADNNEMVYRMQEYHALISRKYKLPVRQIVMYLGQKESKMITKLPIAGVYTGFELVSVHKIDIEEFISDQFPEIIILALLSNYKKEQIEKVLYTIVGNIKKVVNNKDTLNRYINQLLMFSRLRNLETTITKILEDMPITYEIDIEKDYLYKRGKAKGKEELQAEIEKKEAEFREEIEKKENKAKREKAELREEIEKKEDKAKREKAELREEIEKKEDKAKREKAELREEIEKKEEELVKKEIQTIVGLFKAGIDVKTIAKTLNISQKKVKQIIEEWKDKN